MIVLYVEHDSGLSIPIQPGRLYIRLSDQETDFIET